jgi:DNA replication protein DnaC
MEDDFSISELINVVESKRPSEVQRIDVRVPEVKPQRIAYEPKPIPPIDKRPRMWMELSKRRGERYDRCRIDNYVCRNEKQAEVVARLKEFIPKMRESTKNGGGILLFGPKGTGKDHLAMAMAHAAIGLNIEVHWINGADMRGDVRDSTRTNDLEREYVRKLSLPKILWISDPLPVAGNLTDAQQDRLFRVLDARYSRMLPTWVTVNVSSRDELEQRMGPQNADRVRDGALALYCDWPSHREVSKNV